MPPGHRPIEADIVSVVFEDGLQGKCWWLLGKRGDVHTVRPAGLAQERIADAGNGPGKLGSLSSIKLIDGELYATGYCRQVYKRESRGWVHIDQGIVLDEHAMGYSLNDIGGAAGALCAVGSGRFCAAGANGTVLRGDASGFEVLCTGEGVTDALWDIEFHNGEWVVAATAGVFVVREGALVPFDTPAAPVHIGYKLARVGDRLWSIGTHQIFCLAGGCWTEWVCPDNLP